VPRSLMTELVQLVAGRPPDALVFRPNGDVIRSADWRAPGMDWCNQADRAGRPAAARPEARRGLAGDRVRGASVKHVQRMLGHKDAAMTLNVYASLFEDGRRFSRLDQALSRAAAASARPAARRRRSGEDDHSPLKAV